MLTKLYLKFKFAITFRLNFDGFSLEAKTDLRRSTRGVGRLKVLKTSWLKPPAIGRSLQEVIGVLSLVVHPCRTRSLPLSPNPVHLSFSLCTRSKSQSDPPTTTSDRELNPSLSLQIHRKISTIYCWNEISIFFKACIVASLRLFFSFLFSFFFILFSWCDI